MDIVYFIFAVIFIAFSLFLTFLRVRESYKRYYEITGKGLLKFFFSDDRAYEVFFTDKNLDKLKKLSDKTGVSIDLVLNHIVSSYDDSEVE